MPIIEWAHSASAVGSVRVPARGSTNAGIMIVGEAPGTEEEGYQINNVPTPTPFVGSSGTLLNAMLADAGINRDACFITNVCKYRPPNNDMKAYGFVTKTEAKRLDIAPLWGRYPVPILLEGVHELHKEIQALSPNLIIALGDTALWATTGESGITKWRGSEMPSVTLGDDPITKVVPTYHPAGVMRMWPWRVPAIHDLRKAQEQSAFPQINVPDYNFLVRPTYSQVMSELSFLKVKLDKAPTKLAVDIETRAGHIACLGIAWSPTDAICIPFMATGKPEGYWDDPDSEYAVVRAIHAVICHPNARIVGQNFLYDAQYLALYWGARCKMQMDTMVAQHVCWPGTPKSLDYLSSIYCDYHCYWKDEGKTWEPWMDEEQLWVYNCKDCVVTYEVETTLEKQLHRLGLWEQHLFQLEMFDPVLDAMLRGVRFDMKNRGEVGLELLHAQGQYEAWFSTIVDETIHTKPKSKTAKPWYRSAQQCATLFYDELGLKEIRHRKTGRRTTEDDALVKIAQREPLLRPLVERLGNYRSLGVLYNTCIAGPVDPDDKVRCSYNQAGTDTYRLASSKSAFGTGMNLQAVTSGEREEDVKEGSLVQLPNLHKLFIPDPGYIMLAIDLDRADLQVVVAEAEDDELKAMLREGVNIHLENAKAIFGGNPVVSKAAQSPYHLAKQGVHAVNYACKARTLAAELGITVHEASRFITRWLDAHPGIKTWHERTERILQETKSVSNKFSFRFRFFDRVEKLLPEALAWTPQSTVALVINYGWRNICRNPDLSWVQVLMQVHDELVLQIPKTKFHKRGEIEKEMLITIPYDDPLVIPVGAAASDKSWGDCEDVAWR